MEQSQNIPPYIATMQYRSGRNPEYLLLGNIIPQNWYKTITNTHGRPDLTTISILSEIIYWYRPRLITDKLTGTKNYANKFLGDAWQTSYAHFIKKFNFSHETIRRSLVKLENLGIIQREFRKVFLRGQGYNNVLFIHLNSLKKFSHMNKENYRTSISNKECNLQIRRGTTPFNFQPSDVAPSPQIVGDNNKDIKNKKEYKENRSIAGAKSNFLKKFSKSFLGNDSVLVKSEISPSDTVSDKNHTASTALRLKSFYPLSEEDCSKLQILSGRDFSLRAMNEILLDMSRRLTDRYFEAKEQFLNYMGKAFMGEMRDAVKVSNETFRIKNNLKIEDAALQNQIAKDLEVKRQEAYLTELEYSLQVSPEWHFRKKLASVLERSKAYNLLTSFVSSRLEDRKFIITLNRHINLSECDRKIILDQAKATHEQGSFADFQFQIVDSLEILMPEQENKKVLGLKEEYKGQGSDRDDAESGVSSKEPYGLWSRIRKQVASFYGEQGQGIDRNWFSKLEPEVYEKQRIIKLKAPSNFIRDWVSREYSQTIECFLRSEQYKCLIC